MYREAPRVVHSNEAGTCSDQKSQGHNSTIEELNYRKYAPACVGELKNILKKMGGLYI